MREKSIEYKVTQNNTLVPINERTLDMFKKNALREVEECRRLYSQGRPNEQKRSLFN